VRKLAAILAVLILCLFCGLTATLALAQIRPSDAYDVAASAFQHGQLDEAEHELRTAVAAQPNRPDLLGLLALVLDAKKQYQQAEPFHERALQLAPRSAGLWNNFGNHFLASGHYTQARSAFLHVVAIEPTHANANLQLATMALSEKKPAEALRHLKNLKPADQKDTAVQLLRARCLHLSGQTDVAMSIVDGLEKDATGDERLTFSLGVVLAEWKNYKRAEDAFSRALEADPSNVEILHNLGLAALRAGDLDRAQRVFEVAVQQNPNDVDSLFDLGRVYVAKDNTESALVTLARAWRLAPKRADILLYLAARYEDAGFFSGAAQAYEEYIKLKPDDPSARRERGFAYCRFAQTKNALPDLLWYEKKYPRDALGQFELGVCQSLDDTNQGLQHLNQALLLKPDFIWARQVRGLVLSNIGRWNEALPDLNFVAQRQPKNSTVLLQIGRSYLELGRTSEALEFLRRAQAVAPENRAVLTQLYRALRASGQHDEATAVLEKLKTIAPEGRDQKASAHIFDYLELDPAQQRDRIRHNLMNAVAANPSDPELKVQMGTMLLDDGKTEDALAIFHDALTLSPDQRVLREGATSLLQHEQYAAARDFLVPIVAGNPSVDDRLDLATAIFHAAGAAPSLAEIDKIPVEDRNGDFYLLRAQILDALGRSEESAEALNTGFQKDPRRADLYLWASLFLLQHGKDQEAVKLLAQGTSIAPDDPDLLLTRAVVLEIARNSEQADELLQKIEARWPEWGRSYLIRGIILATHRKPEQALQSFRTAIALGEKTASAYYYVADLTRVVTPKDTQAVRQAISEALQLDPNDALSHALAGRIALEEEDPAGAVEQLKEAIRIRPDLAEAHYSLMTAYKKLGDMTDAKAEQEIFRHIREQNPDFDNNSTAEIRRMLLAQGASRQ
jgi:tetratricopeptide (TPR) repeat protein